MDSRWHSKFGLVLWSEHRFWWGWRWFNLCIPLVVFWIGLSMRSNIHAWNMARGWLVERNIWFSHVYSRVVRGSPKPGQICLCLIKAKSSCFCTYLYVVLMVLISFSFSWFNVGYKHGHMTGYYHGYFMYLCVIFKMMDARPNWCHNSSKEKVVIILVMFHKSFQSFMLCLVS